MKNKYRIKLSFIVISMFMMCQFASAQLSTFTLNVSATNETCTGNGSLTFTTSGTTSGATIIFSIYKFPNLTTPVATLAGNTLAGLTGGTYRVVATQSLGNLTNFQQQDYTINNLVEPLTYEIDGNNLTCGVDGTITINTLSGNAVSYEIISGPVIYPIQASNVFNGLVLGSYQIRVFDTCGDGIVQSFSIINPVVGTIGIISNNTYSSTNCTNVLVTQTITNTNSLPIAFPLNIQYTVFHPTTGAAIVFNQILTSGNSFVTQYLPLFPNQYYTYNVKVTDACGNVFNNNLNVVNSSVLPKLFINSLNCELGSFTFAFAQSVTITDAPSTFTGNLPFNVAESSTEATFQLPNLPVGFYTFNVVNVCGNSSVMSYNLSPYSAQEYQVFDRVGCNVGFGSIRIRSNILNYQSVSIIDAPTAYTPTLPQDVSFNIDVTGKNFYMNNLPEGQYTFKIIDECNNEELIYYYIYGFVETNNISITENCGSFDINLFHSSNALNVEYYLQKFDPVLNAWVHPVTGNVGIGGDPYSLNAILLIGSSINYNFTSTGVFRVVFHKFSYGNYVMFEHCYETIYNFEYDDDPKINAVYSFQCANNVYDVLVDANGVGNLTYKITEKNGNVFLVNNGSNPVFLGLEPATYNFQVQDACSNIFNIEYDVPTPFELNIVPVNLCQGTNGSLTTTFFPFLDYQWWKGTDTGTILSTTNSLNFSNFDFLTNGGVYYLRIRYSSNPNSCIDIVLEYTVESVEIIPNAGLDGTISFCGAQSQLNLSNYLTGTFNPNGVWTEITTSGGNLTNNLWNAASVNFGTYQFKYRVNGSCSSFDESFVEITINPIPQTPIVSVDSVVCDGDNLQLYSTTVAGSTYQWTGPNGFTSTDQNPIIENATSINNGIYTVKTLANNCESPLASIAVEISALPEFSIAFECIDNEATLTAASLNNSFDENTATFQWSNADGYSSSTNPTIITGEEKGIYTLTITNSLGCATTNTFEVLNTLCKIPKGVSPNEDGNNDTFDLSGFSNLEKVKIFNRYGVLVYELDNYINQWKGQDKNGKLLPSGTYYYLLNFTNEESKTGWVYLLTEE